MPLLCVYLDMLHFVTLLRFMLLNATMWHTVTHTFQGNEPKLADWSKSLCIKVRSCFCSLLTSKWEFSIGRLLYSFSNFTQITKKLVISSYIDDHETNLPIGKHTLHAFA